MCFPNENKEKTAFVDLPQKGHPTQVAFTSINVESCSTKPSLTIRKYFSNYKYSAFIKANLTGSEWIPSGDLIV